MNNTTQTERKDRNTELTWVDFYGQPLVKQRPAMPVIKYTPKQNPHNGLKTAAMLRAGEI